MTSNDQHLSEIIAGCKAGNRQAQEKLYRSFYQAMMNLCARYTKNDEDAMDALNTGFFKVFKSIDRFDEQRASLYTWIRTIVINSCLDLLAKKEKLVKQEALSSDTDVEIAPEAITRLSAAHLLNEVRKLPAATRAVFNLYVIEGYNHNEISALLNISAGTSKWHLSEARRSLKQTINEHT